MIAFKALPLNNYASLHKLFYLSMAFNFSLQSIFQPPKAQMIFNLRDADTTKPANTAISIKNIHRWRMSIAGFKNFDDYLKTLKSNYKKNYLNTCKAALNYGVNITVIDGDWSEHANTVYQLYRNVARRRKSQLYDLKFFQAIAKMPTYQLIAVWHANKMISVLIILDEAPVYHSMLVGFDYEHSRHIYAYSLIHYELIKLAIATQKHTVIDVGITAGTAKAMMNFKPVPVCMDIYVKNRLLRFALRVIGKILSLRA